MGAGLALQRGQSALEGGDDRPPPARLDVPDGRLDLGRHAALPEVALGLVALEFAERYRVEAPLAGRVEVDGDALHGREDKEVRDAERAREKRRGEVLVDHRLQALPIALGAAHNRDAAAAARDD